MQINFTGIKNVGYNCDFLYPTYEQDGQLVYNSDDYADMNVINMQLTDDFNGKDLSAYKDAVGTSDVENKRHPIVPNFIHLAVLKGELPIDKDTYFFLNGSKLEVNDQNMTIFSFLAKTLKKLKEQSLDRFFVDKDYLFGPDVSQSIKLGQDLRDDYEDDLECYTELSKLHYNEHARNGAAKMFELLENKIYEYLDI